MPIGGMLIAVNDVQFRQLVQDGAITLHYQKHYSREDVVGELVDVVNKDTDEEVEARITRNDNTDTPGINEVTLSYSQDDQ